MPCVGKITWSHQKLTQARFSAMASDCELLFDTLSIQQAKSLGEAIYLETARIESKFSRYLKTSLVSHINQNSGNSIQVDDETAGLLDYADLLFKMSEGRFDITSGVLRQAWHFNSPSNPLPEPQKLQALQAHVGWEKVIWERPILKLQPGMELDLGGLGKEYAVDRALGIARATKNTAILINFGGDLAALGPRADQTPWQVGCWDDTQDQESGRWQLGAGAIATSGNTQRFLIAQGKRYGHILDARTGWPVERAPLSVSVSAPTCLEAGSLSTLAMLHGEKAEAFLEAQNVPYRCLR